MTSAGGGGDGGGGRGAAVTERSVRVGYLGPEGTWCHQALLDAGVPGGGEPTPLATIYDTVMAVHEGTVGLGLVPIENSLEGSVDVTLDALATDAADVAIVGETVHPIRNCLIGPPGLEIGAIETVYSHPQANAQCARFLRTRLGHARVVAASSTAEAVRSVTADPGGPNAALGNHLAAELYGGRVLLDGVDDAPGNATRFVWLALRDGAPPVPATGAAKTSIVFWGAGDETPGWLVRCLSEFSDRSINLTRIESRPHRAGLGRYMFFADLEGAAGSAPVAEAIDRVGGHCETVRVLGSYPVG
ncbi:MAG: prephenate dehydratase [Solirubrobacteraceae bacterium]|nr:prephenate dehydratase [Solirubrobacteraceae bacterium]